MKCLFLFSLCTFLKGYTKVYLSFFLKTTVDTSLNAKNWSLNNEFMGSGSYPRWLPHHYGLWWQAWDGHVEWVYLSPYLPNMASIQVCSSPWDWQHTIDCNKHIVNIKKIYPPRVCSYICHYHLETLLIRCIPLNFISICWPSSFAFLHL